MADYTGADLDALATGQRGATPPVAYTGADLDALAQQQAPSSIGGEFAKGAKAAATGALNAVHGAANWAEQKAADITGSEYLQRTAAADAAELAKVKAADAQAYAPAVPSFGGASGAGDVVKRGAYLAGQVPVLAAEYGVRGLPGLGIAGMGALGAIQGGQEASERNEGDPAATAAGAVIGGAANMIPGHILGNAAGKGITRSALEGAGFGAALGTGQTFADEGVNAIHTGTFTPPSAAQLAEAAASGAIPGALLGAIGALQHGIGKQRDVPPKDVGDATHEEVDKALADPDVAAMLKANGITDPNDPRILQARDLLTKRRAAEADQAGRPIDTDKQQLAEEQAAVAAGTLNPAAASAVNARRPTLPEIITATDAKAEEAAGVDTGDQGTQVGAELRGKFNAPAIIGEPQAVAMTPGDIARARAANEGGNPNTAPDLGGTLTTPADRAPQTRDDVAQERSADAAFRLAQLQRSRAGADVADTQPAARPQGQDQQPIILDQGFPVQIVSRRYVPDAKGVMHEVATVRRYDPRTGQPEPGSVEYEVPTRRLQTKNYAIDPRQSQDFVERANSPAGEAQGLPEQTYRTTDADPNEQFPAAGDGRSPLPEQPEGPHPSRPFSSAEEAMRDFQAREQARKAQEDAARARGEQPSSGGGSKTDDRPASRNAKGQDRDGSWITDENGHVTSDKGGPIRFPSQQEAAKWLLKAQASSKTGQYFEIANHPSGKGFTVKERGRTGAEKPEEPKAAEQPKAEQPKGETPKGEKPTLALSGPKAEEPPAPPPEKPPEKPVPPAEPPAPPPAPEPPPAPPPAPAPAAATPEPAPAPAAAPAAAPEPPPAPKAEEPPPAAPAAPPEPPTPSTTTTVDVGGHRVAVRFPDQAHADLYALSRQLDRPAGLGAKVAELYRSFKPWIVGGFEGPKDAMRLARDYGETVDEHLSGARYRGETRIDAPLAVDTDLEAAWWRNRAENSTTPTTPTLDAPPEKGGFVMVDPQHLTLYPKRFQYKEADERGVTGALHGVKRWESDLANPITAWLGRDGKLYVVNGHQRTDLAKRAQADWQEVKMPARVFREEDGYTPEYMRALGAFQNISEGSGTAIDAAKILRARGNIPEGMTLPELPPKSALVRDAQALADLSEHAFGMVVNGLVPSAHAAEVGRQIRTPGQQLAAMGVLAKEQPGTVEQARIMVEDIVHSGFKTGEQTDMFGNTVTAQSLFGERARILDSAMQQMRKARAIFSGAVRGEDTLSAAGNTLSHEGNVKGKSDSEQVFEYIRANGTRKGPVSDALNAAARDLADGKSLKSAVARFLADARALQSDGRGAEEGVESGAPPHGDGHSGEAPEEGSLLSRRTGQPAEVKAAADEATAALKGELDKYGLGDKIGVKVVDTIAGGGADGAFLDRMISIARDNPDGIRGMLKAMGHEAMHALRSLGLFTEGEWNIISRWADNEGRMKYTVDKDYAGDYPNLSPAERADRMREEAFARHAEAVIGGEAAKPVGLLGRAMSKVQGFLEAATNWARGDGFKTFDGIVKSAMEGDVGRRDGTPRDKYDTDTLLARRRDSDRVKAYPTFLREAIDRHAPDDYRTPKEKINAVFDSLNKGVFARAYDAVFDEWKQADRNLQALIKDGKRVAGAHDMADYSAYAAATWSSRAGAMANRTFERGVPVALKHANGSVRAFEAAPLKDATGNTIGNFDKIIRQVAKDGTWREYAAYERIIRGTRLAAEGRDQRTKQTDMTAKAELERRFPYFKETHSNMQLLHKAYLQAAVDAGVVEPAKAAEWNRFEDYAPFYRSLPDGDISGPGVLGGLVGLRAFKKLKGGADPVGDFLENNLKSWSTTIKVAMKNVAAQRIIADAIDLGIAREIAPHEASKNKIAVEIKFDGKSKHYEVSEPLTFQMLHGLDGSPVPGWLRALGMPARVLRKMTVETPVFKAIKHPFRESLGSYIAGRNFMIPIWDTMVGSKNVMTHAPSAERMQDLGVAPGFDLGTEAGSAANALYAKYMREYGQNLTKVESAAALLSGMWHRYEKAFEFSDLGTRDAIFRKEYAKHGNEVEAAFQAEMQAINFNRHGNSQLLRVATTMIPFLNARLQGLDVLGRAMYQRPGQTFAKGMTLAALTAAYYGLVKDNDIYKHAPDYVRDSNFIIPTGDGHAFLWANPFEAGVLFKNPFEHAARYMMGDDTPEDMRKAVVRAFVDTLKMDPIPQFAQPALEAAFNYSSFKGAPIVPRSMDRLKATPEMQYTPRTSEVAKGLAQIPIIHTDGTFGKSSPMLIDHLIEGYFGTAGKWISDIIDGSIHAVDGGPPRPTPRLGDNAITGSFIKDARNIGNDPMNHLYEMKDKADSIAASVKQLRTEGSPDRAVQLMQNNRALLGMRSALESMAQRIAATRNEEKIIRGLPADKMSADEKAARIEAIQKRRDLILAPVNELRRRAAA